MAAFWRRSYPVYILAALSGCALVRICAKNLRITVPKPHSLYSRPAPKQIFQLRTLSYAHFFSSETRSWPSVFDMLENKTHSQARALVLACQRVSFLRNLLFANISFYWKFSPKQLFFPAPKIAPNSKLAGPPLLCSFLTSQVLANPWPAASGLENEQSHNRHPAWDIGADRAQ